MAQADGRSVYGVCGLLAFAQGKGEVPDSLFDKAVEFIKRAEGWHREQMPYIGYGHRLFQGRH